MGPCNSYPSTRSKAHVGSRGNLPAKYDEDVSEWINRHRSSILTIWLGLQQGDPVEDLVADLPGDL